MTEKSGGYRIEWTRRAARRFDRLPQDVQRLMARKVDALAQDPRPAGKTTKLKGDLEGLYRIQVGIHHRVVFEVDDTERVVTVENVGSREDIY